MGYSKLNPRSEEYEFFGPIGTFLVTIVSPLFLIAQYLICNEEGGCPANLPYILSSLTKLHTFITYDALFLYISWLGYHLLLWLIIPGVWIPGTKLRTGGHVYYKQNAFKILLITFSLAFLTFSIYGPQPFLYVVEKYFELLVTSIAFTFIMSVGLYINSFSGEDNKLLALNGNTGNLFHDFWLGRELNPTFMELDLKEFFELRPGLIGWAFLNFCFVVKQSSNNQGWATLSILFVAIAQIGYVFDSLYNQSAVLTTMDVTTDGFGFMLCFGDISFLPFLYTIQARYLSMFPHELTLFSAILLAFTACLGYFIFRSANGQKNSFRRDPNHPSLAHLTYLETSTGRRLLTSGWWGRASHINYLGDWLLSFSQCLACGFHSFVPYLFVAYFAILLIHRDSRDDKECFKKYGNDWIKYRALVPYHILPYVY